MSSKSQNPDNIYTQQVKQLLEMVYPQEAGFGSVFEDARHFFTLTSELEKHIESLIERLALIENDPKRETLAEQTRKQLKDAKRKLEDERLSRVERLTLVSKKLLDLCEGEDWQETLQNSGKFLGTIMLLTRGPEGNFARVHQRFKPLYKAVLTLRLVDCLLSHDAIAHKYLSKYKEALLRFKGNHYWREKWQAELALPLIRASLLQDIGLQSPKVIRLLRGENSDLDEFRLLDDTQRKTLLKLNYHYTISYLENGLGLPGYVGNDKEERARFISLHQQANDFVVQLVKDAFLSKTGLGEVIKIPQIYVSTVLSTKQDYSRKQLPKGYLLIEQLAKKGSLNIHLASDFNKLVGYFPQGFGITFIPVNEKGIEKDQFECAVVIGLNPKDPMEPLCKVVTRNQKYISSGLQEIIPKSRNLYFSPNKKKLMRIGKQRLTEIMSQLSGNFTPDAVDQLVPGFWEPYDFFSFKKHQNLWAKNH